MSRIYLSPPDVGPVDREAVAAAMNSAWVAPAGPFLAEFESAVTEIVKGKYAVALNSGTAALHLALKLLQIGPGDSVICPSLTFAASANPIVYCGAEPIFIDSEERTWNMDPALLEDALSEADNAGKLPKAVIVVHLYGQCADMEPIVALCARYDIPLIEDAAEAMGATYRGKPAGSFGDYSFFSFNGNKIITTSGGGMLLTSSNKDREHALYLATQAKEPTLYYEHVAVGYNYRLSNVLAALGVAQLSDLARRIDVRRKHYEAYSTMLADCEGVSMMPIVDSDEVNYWLSCIQVDAEISGRSRDAVIQALSDAEIEARPVWKPLHLQPVFKECRVYGGVVSEKLFEKGVCLPSGSSMSSEERERVMVVLRACFQTTQR